MLHDQAGIQMRGMCFSALGLHFEAAFLTNCLLAHLLAFMHLKQQAYGPKISCWLLWAIVED